MAEATHTWRRFWCARDGFIRLDDLGYVLDPEGPFGSVLNPNVKPFEEIAALPCLILLGEPGMGKSVALRRHCTEVQEQAQADGDQALWRDLRQYQTDERLYRSIFESPEFLAWQRGTHRLCLFLDSLDEALLHIRPIASLLAEELKNHPPDRLMLRIACRSAEWPSGLEAELKGHWGHEHTGVFDLVPLRRRDIEGAAAASGISINPFMHEVERAGAVPLAIKPVTLNFLLETYRAEGQLPPRQAELYAKGCRYLCQEHSPSRHDAGHRGALTLGQRVRLTEHIAYLCVFANRSGVWTGSEQPDMPVEVLPISALIGAAAPADIPGEPAIFETLHTGLFRGRGPHELSWAHQTYAEYLAAAYIIHRGMSHSQVMGLLQHPDDPEGRIIPQLHETAAWLAGQDPAIFRRIMACDPEVLLRSDVATADAPDRAALVEALLDLFDRQAALDSDHLLRRRYQKLLHPGLADQLQPYIRDKGKGFLVRRVAIDIAEACTLQALQEDLVAVALNAGDLHSVRVQVAWALVRIADQATKERLTPLAFGQAGPDLDDDLRGCALLALWPSHFTASQLFDALRIPQQEAYAGSYKIFITSHCLQHLQTRDLPLALRWVVAHMPEMPGQDWHSIHRLAAGIMGLGWAHLDEPGVLDAFADAALVRLRRHIAIVGDDEDYPARRREGASAAFLQQWVAAVDERRRLCSYMLPAMVVAGDDPRLLTISTPPLLLPDDFDWLVVQMQSEANPDLQQGLAALVARLFRAGDSEQFQVVYDLVQDNAFLAAQLHHLFGYIELDSPEAAQLRADHRQWQELEEQYEQLSRRRLPDRSPAEVLQQRLEEFEAGDVDAWWRINHVLRFENNGDSPHGVLQVDLRLLPGWNAADEVTRARIVQAAQRYVAEAHDEPERWRLAEGFQVYPPAFAAYRALYLLLHLDRAALLSLAPEVWGRWAAIIVGYPVFGGTEDERPHQALVMLAYGHAPRAVIAELLFEIDKASRNGDRPSALDKFEHCWDDALAAAVLEKVRDPALLAGCLDALLQALFAHRPGSELEAFTASLVAQQGSRDEESQQRRLVAARVLITSATTGGWSTIWPVLQAEPTFGRELIEALAHLDPRPSSAISAHLTEEQIAQLYTWVEQQYPHRGDAVRDMSIIALRRATTRDQVEELRDGLIDVLKRKGTPAAVQALRRLQAAFPDLERLRWILLEAQAITRQATWAPLAPDTLLALARDPSARLVQNGEQLLAVLIESLERLQATLRDETPAVFRLWNEAPAYRPKDEERLSDEIKSHLQADLAQRHIVVNREVVIRPTIENFQGERLDLKIQALGVGGDGQPGDTITAIIEVKGCWNQELPDAMQAQLVDRYLYENTCQHGIYLVGWFNCLAWDKKDYRRGRAEALAPSLAEARARLNSQAESLTGGGRTIRAFVLDAALPQSSHRQFAEAGEPKKQRARRPKAKRESGGG